MRAPNPPNATISNMTTHIDTNDPKYPDAAAEILQRHESGQAEANITSSVRDFLIITGLARPSEIVEENPPSDGSRSAVDLTALDTFIESKRRIGTATGGFNPNPQNVAQLDDYLRQSRDAGKGVRTGILTDGKYWLLRWPDAGPINTSPPYGFVLQPGEGWLALRDWLRDTALVALDSIPADRENVQKYLGPKSPTYQRDIDTLAALYNTHADSETIKVKRRLWYDLLRAALGEIAHDQASLDGLFIRHTYLSLVIGVAVQASFGIDFASWPIPTPLTCCRVAASTMPPASAASSNRTSSPGPTRLAATTSSRRWPDALPASTGSTLRPTLPPSSTKPSFLRRNAAPWASITHPTGWLAPWCRNW